MTTRQKWIKQNPPSDGGWSCFYCGVYTTIDKDRLDMGANFMVLDHFIPRSNRIDLKNDLSNLVPSCVQCNTKKGSIHGDKYCKKVIT